MNKFKRTPKVRDRIRRKKVEDLLHNIKRKSSFLKTFSFNLKAARDSKKRERW